MRLGPRRSADVASPSPSSVSAPPSGAPAPTGPPAQAQRASSPPPGPSALPVRVRGRAPDRGARRLTFVLSVLVHALAALGAIGYSFWHIEEVAPARVTVTFVSAAALPPPPPPPPPPIGGGDAPATPKRRTPVRPKVEAVRVPETPKPVVEAPTVPVVEIPKAAPTPDPSGRAGDAAGSPNGVAGGVKGGVAGGVKGGVAGGTPGGMPGAPVPPKFLAPQMGAQLKLSGAEPDFPAFLRRPGAGYLVMAKICVGVSGTVETVTVQKRAEPTLDSNVVTAVKAWRFKPMTANGTPVPFCYFGRFEFKSE